MIICNLSVNDLIKNHLCMLYVVVIYVYFKTGTRLFLHFNNVFRGHIYTDDYIYITIFICIHYI